MNFPEAIPKTLEESVVLAMDGSNPDLFPFLPFIMQDLWALGADPDTTVKLIRKHCKHYSKAKVLDLGCGKGAVSVKVAQILGCSCHGIDAVPVFIEFARRKAIEHKVGHLCKFEKGDIRTRIKEVSGYDVVILGAIGPVFGNLQVTLTILADCLNAGGFFVVDEAYISDDSDFCHPSIHKQSEMLRQLEQAGMLSVENDIMDRTYIRASNDFMVEHIKRRCTELAEKYPEKRLLFHEYIKIQEAESYILENEVICTTMVIRRQ